MNRTPAPTRTTGEAERSGRVGDRPERAYCPTRLRKAAMRYSERAGPNQFRVRGTEQEWYDVNLDLDTPCDCKDAQYHGRGCLHELRARLHNGDVTLLTELGMMLLKAEQAKEK